MASGNEIDEIRRQMAQIRRELHEDIQGVVAGAEAVTDWRRYVRLYPWACVAGAVVLGYLIVPKRHRTVAEVVEEIAPAARARGKTLAEAPTKKEKRAGLLGTLFGMVMPIGVRVVQSYATSYLENWIAQQGIGGVIPGLTPDDPGGPGGSMGPSGPGRPTAPGRPGPGPGPR